MNPEPELDVALRLTALADYSRACAIGAIATLGIAELFQEPRSAAAAAAEASLDAAALRQLLRALVSCGLFEEPQREVFVLGAAARYLLDANEYSLRGAYSLMPHDMRAWAHVDYSLRTGRGAFDRVHGQSLWQYLADHPEASALFDRSMEDMSRLELLWLLDAYDWTRFNSVADIGGGAGETLIAVLTAHPKIEGLLFDTPAVTARAIYRIDAAGLAERCLVHAGDFFDSVPAGYDAYMLKRIVYSYDDVGAARILTRVRDAMPPHGRVLLVEPVKRRGDEFEYSKLLDMQMLILGGGRVRDRRHLRELLGSVGLRLRRVIPTPLAAIVEATPE